MSRTRFPNTARRIAIACGFSGDGIGTQLPNTFARFAAQLGLASTRTRFPNTMERLCEELEAAGGGAYHADAVHFDGSTFLSIASLTSTDNDKFSFAFWVKPTNPLVAQIPWWATDPEVNLYNGFRQQEIVEGQSRYSFFGTSTDFNSDVSATGADNSVPVGAWCILIGSMDATTGDIKVYRGDVDITADVATNSLPFVFSSNGLPMFICSDNVNSIIGDIADMWVAPGQTLLTAGDIPEATRRKFLSAAGKPVDLGADGSVPTGTAPAVYFTGDATAFSTNRGTGGAFTLTGALTNAPTSPSD